MTAIPGPHRIVLAVATLAAGSLFGCGKGDSTVEPFAETAQTGPRKARRDPGFWLDAGDKARSLVIGSDLRTGLETFTLAGELFEKVANPVDDAGSSGVDVRYEFPIDDGSALVASASRAPAIDFYTVDSVTRKLIDRGAIPLPFDPRGVCLHRDPTEGSYFAFAFAEDGRIEQWRLAARGSAVVSAAEDVDGLPRPVRGFDVGGTITACVVDDESGTLYVTEEGNALWAYRADPVMPVLRRLVSVASPIGHLSEAAGVALARSHDGRPVLVVGDKNEGFLLFRPGTSAPFLGRFGVGTDGTAPDPYPFGPLEVVPVELPGHPRGIAVLGNDAGYHFVDVARIGKVLGLAFGVSRDLRPHPPPGIGRVRAEAETEPTPNDRDAADDPAIWVHPRDPARSVILATDKKGGLLAHDLHGRRIDYLRAGQFNNVDLRGDFRLGGESVTLVAISDRSRDTIALYRVNPAFVEDPARPFLERVVADSFVTVRDEIKVRARPIYGICLYQDATGTYAFATSQTGQVEQYLLTGRDDGTVEARSVKWFEVSSTTEGCVADDEHGWLYVAEESRGIWRIPAAVDAEVDGTLIDRVGDGRLVADVEGLSLYKRGAEGYLVASSQGNNSFVVYDRQTARPEGVFKVIADDVRGVDAVEDCDGIDIVSDSLGPDYPDGLMVVQDGFNVDAAYRRLNQNFKLIPWRRIAEALHLPATSGDAGGSSRPAVPTTP